VNLHVINWSAFTELHLKCGNYRMGPGVVPAYEIDCSSYCMLLLLLPHMVLFHYVGGLLQTILKWRLRRYLKYIIGRNAYNVIASRPMSKQPNFIWIIIIVLPIWFIFTFAWYHFVGQCQRILIVQ